MLERRTDFPTWFAVKISDPIDGGCWLWIAALSSKQRLKDYGKAYIHKGFVCGGMRTRAHRAAWILANGPIPKGMSVLHRCDRPRCVNPMHLFLGTQDDNMKDSARKGRQKATRARGPRHGNSVLTWGDVAMIRNSSMTIRSLATQLGVSVPTVSRARRGVTYARA